MAAISSLQGGAVLDSGRRLGPFRIEGLLEVGGMAEVYRALDTRLDRLVAIKVLPRRFSSSQKSRERFEVEARAISGLSHPNICRLYDVGKEDEIDYLILEYLEGETLADRLDQGPLPPRQYLPIAMQMAEALDHAHRRGILHRDIKPSNIMLTKEGARLMDFGVAKLLEPPTDAVPNNRHARLSKVTEDDKIVGTYDYMAPEQIAGREVDARTDIFAIGAVIYEMATRHRALPRMARQDSPARGAESAERQNGRKPVDPPALNHVIEVCLADDPEDRWQSARDLVNELKWIEQKYHSENESRLSATLRSKLAILGVVLAVLAATSGLWLLRRNLATRPDNMVKFSIGPPSGGSLDALESGGMIAVSPDGQQIVFVVEHAGIPALWVRALNDDVPKKLEDTEGASYPFWSKDNHRIGFFADGKLKVVERSGSPAQVICDAPKGRGGTWNSNGTIVFSPDLRGGLYQVTLQDRMPKPLLFVPRASLASHRWPSFLPDGKHFLYTVTRSSPSGIFVGSLDGSSSVQLFPDVSKAEYSSQGYILFTRSDGLVVQKFDPVHFKTLGKIAKVADGVPTTYAYAPFATSDNGVIAYRPVKGLDEKMVIYDKTGKVRGTLSIPSAYSVSEPSVSPDESRVAMSFSTGLGGIGGIDVWIYELSSGRFSPLLKSGVSGMGIWGPDGKHMIFGQHTESISDLFETDVPASGAPTLLYHSAQDKSPLAWSHDGSYLVFDSTSPRKNEGNNLDLWVLPLFGDRTAYPLVSTPANETHANISPDDRWLAFASDESGISEIYVTDFPRAGGRKWQVSIGGGDQPSWDKSGRTVYYIGPDHMIMAVDFQSNKRIAVGKPRALFQSQIAESDLHDLRGDTNNYVLLPEETRFLVRTRHVREEKDIEVLFNASQLVDDN